MLEGATPKNDLCLHEQNRRKEPLEEYPLDAMSMVGSMDKSGQRVALVKIDKLLHQVRVVNHLGQSYGLVTKLSEQEVTLREIIQDGSGDCIERTVTLQLQESQK
jgi:type IV pilus assembly protein PilP